jgi:hypothetical protein
LRASQKLPSSATVEFDDVCAIDPLPIAKVPHEPPRKSNDELGRKSTDELRLDDTVEIELTAEQMDALLSGC